MAPKFEDNIILTKTERLMMSNRPPDQLDLEHRGVHGAAVLYAVQDWFRRPEHSGRTLRR